MLAARSLIDTGVQLQMDLVQPAGDVQHERSIRTSLGPVRETDWEAMIQQLGRSRVEPVGCKSQGAPDITCGFDKLIWQWLARRVLSIFDERYDIEIACDPCRESEKQ